MKIAMAIGPGFEDLEHWAVYMRMAELGAQIVTVGARAGEVYTAKSGGLTAQADTTANTLQADELTALLIPGGWAPDKLRRDTALLELIRSMDAAGKLLGFICHAGWVAASAGIVRGRKAAGSLGIKDDMENAGAEWVDQPALRDGNIVWGRVVADIPAYNRLLAETLTGN
ncbi:type 1 glutamine amidotransferase domain-containing protein [Spirochaeta africana]|uniref:Putative intracellular protease/amidase n=1 Tax=Spirochaeta africana (strain ATCC 700263 / DSM 8902 / Z-7692) TaxID=889378 RepID=H9UJZ8_SPIAZ|nr:type 1 glutamine amidotransferase domain-containing protein [Spirochaeta africana]AFG37841.1 putative intracellular protease/amidase [Spirochaeta africana DSM 8902]